MAEVRRLPSAESDIDEIWDYISDNSEENAIRMLRRIDQICTTLADNPMIGRARSELAQGLRSFPVGSYLIFYRAVEDGVEIVRVLHGSRDIEAQFEQ